MAEYKDVTSLKKEIADFKKVVSSPNSDYLTGYICALSVTEGIIANLPAADVVKVVRCKDCIYWNSWGMGSCTMGCAPGPVKRACENDFCSYGERKEQE